MCTPEVGPSHAASKGQNLCDDNFQLLGEGHPVVLQSGPESIEICCLGQIKASDQQNFASECGSSEKSSQEEMGPTLGGLYLKELC